MSTTVIDSLLVTLGLDPSSFKKGQAEAAKSQKEFVDKSKRNGEELSVLEKKAAAQRAKDAKELRLQGKKTVETLSSIKNQALSVAGIFLGGMGLVEFAKSTIVTTAALGRFSDNVGISVNQLAGWKLAAKEIGGSAQDMMGDIDKASQTLALKRSKGIINESLQAYLMWGGKTQHGELNDTQSYMYGMADLLKRYNAIDPAKALMIARSLGLSDSSFNLMKQGSAALKAQVDASAKLANITRANADEAIKAQKAWTDLDEAMGAVARTALNKLSPAMSGLTLLLKGMISPDTRGSYSQRIKNTGGWLHFLGQKQEDANAILEGRPTASETRRTSSGLIRHVSPSSGSDIVSARNNNPGNIRYGAFARSHGATGQDSRGFAIFPSVAAGDAAGKALLGTYLSTGSNTIAKAVSRWAPASENNTAEYIASVSKRTGIDPNRQLTNADIAAVSQAMYRVEGSSKYGVSPRVASFARTPTRSAPTIASNSSTSEVHIGEMHINTQATDAKGIAKDIQGNLGTYLVSQANTGMK